MDGCIVYEREILKIKYIIIYNLYYTFFLSHFHTLALATTL